MDVPQPLPSENSAAGVFARHLALLLGPAFQPTPNSIVLADMYALGQAVNDSQQTNFSAIAEAFPNTAVQLLADLETRYGLPVRTDLTTTQRQARLLAKVRAARAGSPQAMELSLDVIEPTAYIVENLATTITTGSTAGAAWGTGSWGIGAWGGISGTSTIATVLPGSPAFLFAIIVPAATWSNPNLYQQLYALASQMKPAHTKFYITVNDNFLCDDVNSLTDRDVLGV